MRWVVLWLGLTVFASGFARAEAPADRIATYEDRAVGVRTIAPLGRDGVTVDRTGSTTWDAFQGRDHHPIDEEAFFRIVGRDDLADRFRVRTIEKKSLMAAGAVAIVGGAMYSMLTYLGRGSQPAVVPCASSANCTLSSGSTGPNPAWGLLGIGTGLASLVIGYVLDPTPIGAAEADALARDHDERLKADLGLSDVGCE